VIARSFDGVVAFFAEADRAVSFNSRRIIREGTGWDSMPAVHNRQSCFVLLLCAIDSNFSRYHVENGNLLSQCLFNALETTMNSPGELMGFEIYFVARRRFFSKHVGGLTNHLLEVLGGSTEPELAH
jgi:hypothetical protein